MKAEIFLAVFFVFHFISLAPPDSFHNEELLQNFVKTFFFIEFFHFSDKNESKVRLFRQLIGIKRRVSEIKTANPWSAVF